MVGVAGSYIFSRLFPFLNIPTVGRSTISSVEINLVLETSVSEKSNRLAPFESDPCISSKLTRRASLDSISFNCRRPLPHNTIARPSLHGAAV